jgi:hypothetical protein
MRTGSFRQTISQLRARDPACLNPIYNPSSGSMENSRVVPLDRAARDVTRPKRMRPEDTT